jgi:hypothetical protein
MNNQKRVAKLSSNAWRLIRNLPNDLSTSKTNGILMNTMTRSNLKLSGKRYGRWAVIERAGSTKFGESLWKCVCDCGTERLVRGSRLVNGTSLSCGCVNHETITSHGMANTRQYHIWQAMKTRCTNTKQPNFERYGGRGIMYDPHWETFENFWEDMKASYANTLTLERIDNSEGYSKENCRWVTPAEQNRNMRSNIIIEYKGNEYCLTDLATVLSVPRKRLYYHHAKGLNGDELINRVMTLNAKIRNPMEALR